MRPHLLLLAALVIPHPAAAEGWFDSILSTEVTVQENPTLRLFGSTPAALILHGEWMVSPRSNVQIPGQPVPSSFISISFPRKETTLQVPEGKPALALDKETATQLVATGLSGAVLISQIPISRNGEVVLMQIERQVGTEVERGGKIVPVKRVFYAVAGNMQNGWQMLAMAGYDQFKMNPQVFAFDAASGSAILSDTYRPADISSTAAATGPANGVERAYVRHLIDLAPGLREKFTAKGAEKVNLEKALPWARTRTGFTATATFYLCGMGGCDTDVLGKGHITADLTRVAPGFLVLKARGVTIE